MLSAETPNYSPDSQLIAKLLTDSSLMRKSKDQPATWKAVIQNAKAHLSGPS